jgi:hypothetical protein
MEFYTALIKQLRYFYLTNIQPDCKAYLWDNIMSFMERKVVYRYGRFNHNLVKFSPKYLKTPQESNNEFFYSEYPQ